MRTVYDAKLGARITYDDDDRVRTITQVERPAAETTALEAMALPAAAEAPLTPRDVAAQYVERIAGLLNVPGDALEAMSESATHLQPQEKPVQYRVSDEKTLFDATTVGFAQTVHEVPVWGSGISVVVRHGPYRVVSASDSTAESRPDPKMPPDDVIQRYQRLFAVAEAEQKLRETRQKFGDAGEAVVDVPSSTAAFVQELTAGATAKDAYLIRGRFFIYQYDPAERLPSAALLQPEERAADAAPRELPFTPPPVPDSIVPGAFYMVAELTFMFRHLVWQALVELETTAVLYLRPMGAGVTGLVFRLDPITATGVNTNTSAQTNAVLNPLRTPVELRNLQSPANGTQTLRGTRAVITERHPPSVAGPQKPTGTNFDFDARTNDFAAVNAYYHVNNFFEVVESLGFPIASYFQDTVFPLAVDHRASFGSQTGIEINAHCDSNGRGGIGHVCFALGDLTDTAHPLGRACDSRVYWHELGGHGVLYGFVNSPNFRFAHSAGDSLSAIYHDPESHAPDRFRYAPFHPSNDRHFNREVADGWAWGGPMDLPLSEDAGYQAEQILATTLFRVYRAIGGDSPDPARKRFASRMMLYLVLRAISTLTQATNPKNAVAFADALIAVDLLNWTSEGVFGGAYGKVIRWSFEKQGAYRGQPPEVDVYIDDGRHGQYGFVADHAQTATVWNRLAADGGTEHEDPKRGATNFAFVKIKNRGTKSAADVKVRAFHSKAGARLVWPNDFEPMRTAEIAVGALAANDAEEKIVGPFEWTPAENASGGDSMLMIVTASEDPSNADNFGANASIDDWRLVPNDNNIAQRNVTLQAGNRRRRPSG